MVGTLEQATKTKSRQGGGSWPLGWCNKPLVHRARRLFVSSCPPSETCFLLDAGAGSCCHLQAGLRSQALEGSLRPPLRQALQAGQVTTCWLAAQHDNHTGDTPELHAALLDSALQHVMCRLLLHLSAGPQRLDGAG